MKRVIGLAVIAFLVAGSQPATATHTDKHCFTRLDSARALAEDRVMKRRWVLEFWRDRNERPCLFTSWHRYGSLYPFRVRKGHPRLGMLDLAGTSAQDRSAYVMTAYVSESIARVTWTIRGRTTEIDIVSSPRWAHLRKNLFTHVMKGYALNRGAKGKLRIYNRRGQLVREKTMRWQDFVPSIEVGKGN